MMWIDGVLCEDYPMSVEDIRDDYAPKMTRFPVFTGRTMSSIDTRFDGDYHQYTKQYRKAYSLTWDGAEAPAGLDTYLQLKALYESQREFWFRLDSAFGRNYARCQIVSPTYEDINANKVVLTPTFPIFPYNYDEDTNTGSYQMRDLIVGGDVWDLLGDDFDDNTTIDSEAGIVVLHAASALFTPATQVHFRYTTRMKVRIVSLEMTPVDLSQRHYQGRIILETVAL